MSAPNADPSQRFTAEIDPQARILNHALQALSVFTVRSAHERDSTVNSIGLEYHHGSDKDGADASFRFLCNSFQPALLYQTGGHIVTDAGFADNVSLQLDNPPLRLIASEPIQLEPVSMATILNSLVKAAPMHTLHDWARRAVNADVQSMPTAARTKYMQTVIKTFGDKWGVDGFQSLITADKDLDENSRSFNYQGDPTLLLAMNHKVRGWVSKSKDVDEVLQMMADEDVIMPEIFCNVKMMSNPTVAKIIATKLSSQELFNDITPEARRNMAMLLVQKVFDRFIASDDRNQKNAVILRKVLFDNKYSTIIPMTDLIKVANGISQKQNASRSLEKQQTSIPVFDNSSAHLAYCGEAIFRILAVTSTSKDHGVENRNYAEIFDALMEPHYRSVKESRVITTADIFARYPDAEQDVVLILRDAASGQGFSQASQVYRLSKQRFSQTG